MQSELKPRLVDQISEDGEQKYEMERTKSLSYCCFNILAYEYCKDASAGGGQGCCSSIRGKLGRRVERSADKAIRGKGVAYD